MYCIVTAASYNHGTSLLQLLKSLESASAYPIFVYDLGLGTNTKVTLKHNQRVTLRTFHFSRYPDHFQIAVARGAYAWKPVIIQQVLDECSAVLWLDAGNRALTGAIDKAFKRITDPLHGFLSTRTSGTIANWVHPGMRQYLAHQGFEVSQTHKMCNGAIVGFAKNHPRDPTGKIMNHWVACSMNRSCIAPPGSSRRNHRQDQAALTVLAHATGFGDVCAISEGHWDASGMIPGELGIKLHQDEGVRDRPASGPGLCGCYWDGDQRRSVALLDMPPCQSTRCGKEPTYFFSATSLAGSPDIRAFGRAAPMAQLYTQKTQVAASIGVAMASYGSCDALQASLPTLFSTMHSNWELVVVVDRIAKGVDDSLDVARKVVDQNFRQSSCTRVQIVDQQTPIWETSANNMAMRMMATDVFLLIQPDMLFYETGWAQMMMRILLHDPTLFALSGRCAHNFDGSQQIGRCGMDINNPPPPSAIRVHRTVMYRQTCNRGPLMLHAATTRSLGLFDEKHFYLENDDHDLVKRATHQVHPWPSLRTIFLRIFMGYDHIYATKPLRTRAGYIPIGFTAPLNLSARRSGVAHTQAEAVYIAHRRHAAVG